MKLIPNKKIAEIDKILADKAAKETRQRLQGCYC